MKAVAKYNMYLEIELKIREILYRCNLSQFYQLYGEKKHALRTNFLLPYSEKMIKTTNIFTGLNYRYYIKFCKVLTLQISGQCLYI